MQERDHQPEADQQEQREPAERDSHRAQHAVTRNGIICVRRPAPPGPPVRDECNADCGDGDGNGAGSCAIALNEKTAVRILNITALPGNPFGRKSELVITSIISLTQR